MEIIEKRSIKTGKLMAHFVQPVCQRVSIANPELADYEDVVATLGSEILDPFTSKNFGEVLYGVHSEAFETEFFRDPNAPFFGVVNAFMMVVIDITVLDCQ